MALNQEVTSNNENNSILDDLNEAVYLKSQIDLKKCTLELLKDNCFYSKKTLPEVSNVYKQIKKLQQDPECIQLFKLNKFLKFYVLNVLADIASETLSDQVGAHLFLIIKY